MYGSTSLLSHEPSKKPAGFEEAIIACGYGKFNYLFLLTMVPVCCAQVFSSLTLSYVLPTADCDLQLTNLQKGALNACVYVGTFTGAFFWGFGSDIFGRKKVIITGLLLDSVFNFLTSAAHTFWLLLVFKIFAGFCITGPTAAVSSYVAETHDSERRQKVLMITGGISAFFLAVQPALAYLVIPLEFRIELIPGTLYFTSWRLFLILSAVPSFLGTIAFIFVPESPKFLMSKGRAAEALKSFQKIYKVNTGNPADTYPIDELKVPLKPKKVLETSDGGVLSVLNKGWVQIRPIFRKPYRNKALIVFTIQACIMISMNSIRAWVPQLFASLDEAEKLAIQNNSTGLGETRTICDLLHVVMPRKPNEVPQHARLCSPISGEVYLRALAISAAAAFSFLISTVLIGHVTGKNLAKICLITAASMVISVNWATNINVFMAILAVYTAMIRNSFALMSTIHVDLFPTAFRSVAISMCLNCGRIASLAGNLLFPVLLSIGCSVIFFSLGGLLAVAMILLWFVENKVERL